MKKELENVRLQNLLAVYQLQTTNGMVVQMANGGWEKDPDGNSRKTQAVAVVITMAVVALTIV